MLLLFNFWQLPKFSAGVQGPATGPHIGWCGQEELQSPGRALLVSTENPGCGGLQVVPDFPSLSHVDCINAKGTEKSTLAWLNILTAGAKETDLF